MSYLGLFGRAEAERVIERSRFLGYAARTAGEEEAQAFLGEVRKLHPAATHVCYAYIADPLGNLQRFSDAGEPQGTAGLPILGVLKAQSLCESTIAVVRYFGGVKLGAGGLVRAYAGTAADVLLAAEKRSFEPCRSVRFLVAYPEVGPLLKFLEQTDAEIAAREFASEAAVTVAVRESEREALCKDAVSALGGRVRVDLGELTVYPFALK